MTRYVAFLGSINVGGNQLKMADLRAALEEEGFENVATVVASGNVLFDHSRAADTTLEAEIGALIGKRFGIKTFAAVRTRGEIESAVRDNPFHGEGEDKLVHTHFLEIQPSAEQFRSLIDDHAGRGPERLAPGPRCLYIDFVTGAGNSKLTSAWMAKRLGCRGTARNMRSLERILTKLD